MKFLNRKSDLGFTLLELLVVVAIVGILLAVITDFLGAARNKSRDAGIKQDMAGLRNAMALYETTHGGWPCGIITDPSVPENLTKFWTSIVDNTTKVTAVRDTGGTSCGPGRGMYGNDCAGVQNTNGCSQNGNKYTVAARLSTGKFWCVDSEQNGREVAINFALDPARAICP